MEKAREISDRQVYVEVYITVIVSCLEKNACFDH